MTLKWKMSLWTSGLVGVVVASFAAASYLSESRALLRAQRDRELQSALGLAEVCREAIIGDQVLGLANYLKKLKTAPETAEAWCADMKGVLLGHTDVAKTHTAMDRGAWGGEEGMAGPVIHERPDAVEARAPVLLAGRRVATAAVLFSREAMGRRFEQELRAARRRLLPLAAGALAAGFAGALALTGLALRPLGTLVDGVRTIARGKLDHQISLPTRDELGWLAREFNQMAEKLQELDRMKQDFVNGVTHDLKSPLATVAVSLDLLGREGEKGALAPKVLTDNLLAIRRSHERLSHMITSLLEVAHIEQGLRLERAALTLDDVAERAAKSFSLIAGQKGLSLDVVVETALSPVMGDAAKLERAVANLVSNAVKYTEKGGVTLSVADREGRQELRVSDTGPGIPPEAMEKLFSKFFRVKRPGEKAEGTGLGLSVAKGIAEAHGGGVSVVSLPGKGTTFILWLPR